MREVSVLLGLMCKYSCEDCVLVIFDADREKYVEVELEKGTILENMAVVLDKDLDNVSSCKIKKIGTLEISMVINKYHTVNMYVQKMQTDWQSVWTLIRLLL